MKKATHFYIPGTNLVGVGCLSNLGPELAARGYKKALIVTDKNLVRIGHVDRVEQILKDNNIAFTVFDEVEHPNPVATFVENGMKHIKSGKMNPLSKDYDFVISIGGGTNHDTARSIAALTTNGGSIVDYEGFNRLKKPILPWVAINTTAGSGAHMTMLDVMGDESRKTKMSIIDPRSLATITVNDPNLHISAPKEVTISAGIDILAHAVEAYVALNANPITDALALGAIKLFINNIRKVYMNGNDLEARDNLAFAAAMAAIAFNNAGLGHVHTIAHQIGGDAFRHHGLTAGALLPYVLEFNAPSINVQRFIDIAIALGENEVTPRNAVKTVLSAIKQVNADIGIPENLSELGAKEENIKYYAEMALKDIAGLTNPRQATLADIIKIIRRAMGLETDENAAYDDVYANTQLQETH